MNSSKRTHVLLLVWIVVCAGTISCKLVDLRAPRDKTEIDSSGNSAEKGGKEVLSRKEIVQAANRAVRRQGYDLAKYYTFYDEGNAAWEYFVTRLSPPESESERGPVWPEGAFDANLRSRWPKLGSYDYQAVYYVFRLPPGRTDIIGRTWILVDRNTGEVLLVFKEAG